MNLNSDQFMNEPFSSPDVSNKFQYYPSPETNLKKRDTWEMNKVQEHDYIAKSNQIHNNLPFPIPQCKVHQSKIYQLIKKLKNLELQGQKLQKQNTQIMQNFQKSSMRQKKVQQSNQVWRKKYQKLRAENDRKALKFVGGVGVSVLAKHGSSTSGSSNLNQSEMTRRQKSNSKQVIYDYSKTNRGKPNIREQLLSREQKQYLKQLQDQQNKRKRSYSSSTLRQVQENSQPMRQLDQNIKNNRKRNMSTNYKHERNDSYCRQGKNQIDNNCNKISSERNERKGKKYSATLEDGLVIHIIDTRQSKKTGMKSASSINIRNMENNYDAKLRKYI